MTLTPRLESTLRHLIEHGPSTIADLVNIAGFSRNAVSGALYELRRMGLAGNGSAPGSGWEDGASKRAWTATDAGRTALAETEPAVPCKRTTPLEPPAIEAPGPALPWTAERLQSLFMQPGCDVRDKFLYARERSMTELLKITGLSIPELDALLVRANGFAKHGGHWTWNKLLMELARDQDVEAKGRVA